MNSIIFKSFVAIILIFCLQGCFLLLPFYGVKEMTPQNEEAQKDYLTKLEIEPTHLYSLSCLYKDSLSHEKFALNTHKLNYGTKASPVQFRLYNRNGIFLTGWEQCFGKATRFGYFNNYPMKPNFNNMPINQSLTLSNDLYLFDISEDQRNELFILSQQHDYTFILIWAEYAGVFNKRLFRDIYGYIKNDNQHNYLVLKLNCAVECK